MAEKNTYATMFSEMRDSLPGHGLAWLCRLRQAAIERFIDLGFPSTRLEEWKYTNVAPISRLPFRPALSRPGRPLPGSVRSELDLFPSPRLVFIDGIWLRNCPGQGQGTRL